MKISLLTKRRWLQLKGNRRAWLSLKLFLGLFLITLCAELFCNSKPLMVWYAGKPYFPVIACYPETTFGGEFPTEADYQDPQVQRWIQEQSGWILWPLIPYDYKTVKLDLTVPAPSPPGWGNWLGTDDQGRDVLARLVYGFRLSILFGLILTTLSSMIGIFMGAIQGYFGGWVDLFLQRFIEIWSGLPILFLLIIVSTLMQPSFWFLLSVLLLFRWISLAMVVRAEFLRARCYDYVRAAQILGISHFRIMWRHILPNAMVAALTKIPFSLNHSIILLTSLDFLGFGLPLGSPSLGEMLQQGKNNLHAPWLGCTAFMSIALLLTLLTFIGEGVRDAFDPRKIS